MCVMMIGSLIILQNNAFSTVLANTLWDKHALKKLNAKLLLIVDFTHIVVVMMINCKMMEFVYNLHKFRTMPAKAKLVFT